MGDGTTRTSRLVVDHHVVDHHVADDGDRVPGWLLAVVVVGFVLPLGAVVLEVLSGTYANSPIPGWGEWVPLAWPSALRTAWWVAVATAVAGFHWSLGRLGLPVNRVVAALTIVPFLAFAVGVATGAEWATWH